MQLEIPIPTIIHTLEICSELKVPVLLNPAPAGGYEKNSCRHTYVPNTE